MNGTKELCVPQKNQKRILALDAARGLAVIGMYIQHFALNDYNASIVSGNTMILFILCSGISYSVMADNAKKKGMEPKKMNAKVLARAVFIDLTGYLLIMLNGPFAVILTAYAALFVMALALKDCSERMLAVVSGISFVVSPVIMIIGMSLFENAAMLADLAGGPLSAAALFPVFTAGMAIGRTSLRDVRQAVFFVFAGILSILLVSLLAEFVLPGIKEGVETWMMSQPAYSVEEIDEYAPWPQNVQPVLWYMLFAVAPQSSSLFTLIQGMGAALFVLGLMCLLEKKCSMLLKPFGMAGQAALTLYVLQIILGWALSLAGIYCDLGSIFFGDILVAVLTTVCGMWLCISGGPVERLMRQFENIFS